MRLAPQHTVGHDGAALVDSWHVDPKAAQSPTPHAASTMSVPSQCGVQGSSQVGAPPSITQSAPKAPQSPLEQSAPTMTEPSQWGVQPLAAHSGVAPFITHVIPKAPQSPCPHAASTMMEPSQ